MNNFISLDEYKNSFNKTQSKPVRNKIPSKNTQLNYSIKFESELKSAKKQNGLIEKTCDFIKNKTGWGFGSKKLEESIRNSNLTKEETKKQIKRYRVSQENTAQIAGDGLSILGSGLVFFNLKKILQYGQGVLKINKVDDMASFIKKILPIVGQDTTSKTKGMLNLAENFVKHVTKNNRTIFSIAALGAFFTGGIIKKTALEINRIGTKQYKAEIDKEKMSKEEIKEIKKQNKKQKRNANFRNFISGGINGLTMPIVGVLGIAGAPLYAGANIINRYFIANRENKKEKSIDNFIDFIKSSPFSNGFFALSMLIPLAKAGKTSTVFNKNIQSSIQKLTDAKLEKMELSKSSYDEVEEILLKNSNILEIINSSGSDEKAIKVAIQDLERENIFALKFLQIKDDRNFIDSIMSGCTNIDIFTKMLREDCPPSRTLAEAQKFINKTFNSNYEVSKCLGVGTIAETYLAKDSDGREVCIKILKNGINAEKIEKDKNAVIEMIKASNKTDDEKQFLIKNFENIANGVKNEIDLRNEMKAAQELAKHTTKAKVVKGIKVSENNDAYIMEKADGISLASFMKLNELEKDRAYYEKWSKKGFDSHKKKVEEIQEEIEKIRQKTPGYNSIELKDEDQANKILDAYNEVLVEQFHKTELDGKTIHGDIHPGNIFIDFEKLKRGDKDFLTLIDTGNVLTQNKDQAIRAMNLTKYVHRGDWDNITKFCLEGATLPEGMDENKAYELISSDLKEIFFDDKTNLQLLNNDNILNLLNTIFKKHGIISSDTQGALNKAKKSAENSLSMLKNKIWEIIGDKIDEKIPDDSSIATRIFICAKEGIKHLPKRGLSSLKNKLSTALQEKANLRQLPVKDRIALIKNKKVPAKNSEDYITFRLKQVQMPEIKLGDIIYSLDKPLSNISLDSIVKLEKIFDKNGIDISKLNKDKISKISDILKGHGEYDKTSGKYITDKTELIIKELFNQNIEDSNLDKIFDDILNSVSTKNVAAFKKAIQSIGLDMNYFNNYLNSAGIDTNKIDTDNLIKELLNNEEIQQITASFLNN